MRELAGSTPDVGEPTVIVRRLDKRSVLFWQVENAVGVVVVLVLCAILSQVSVVPQGWDKWILVLAAAALGLALLDALVWIPRRYRYYQYALTADCIIIERGRLWRRREVYPLARILYCETRQGPILGWFNLFTVKAATIVETRSIGPLSKVEADRVERLIRGRTE